MSPCDRRARCIGRASRRAATRGRRLAPRRSRPPPDCPDALHASRGIPFRRRRTPPVRPRCARAAPSRGGTRRGRQLETEPLAQDGVHVHSVQTHLRELAVHIGAIVAYASARPRRRTTQLHVDPSSGVLREARQMRSPNFDSRPRGHRCRSHRRARHQPAAGRVRRSVDRPAVHQLAAAPMRIPTSPRSRTSASPPICAYTATAR